ncbi:extracellular solute-binding protein [Lachnospiraceae bacterium WCA-9-b2]|uniref:Extracellular solute-binding protein n=1 Tax=Sporofaciens musculi TaxID=2681861 RepID=A0A7X3MJS8_9FIRM|nr:ABC transporter substrate-binding protein [Sporofaciens musculi]MXP77706.1 extracellular solute-binding protein [Sporofaciens musculi]
MKRKWLSVLLCASMVAALAAGCGSDAGGGSDSGSGSGETKSESSDGKTTLTFWCHENEPWVKSYKEMAKKFEDANPDYKVEVQDYPFKVYNDKIQTALTSSTAGPDIVAVWGGTAPSFIESDALAEVPEDMVKELEEDYLAPTLGIYQKEGKYYGVPMEFNLEYGGMIVNKKLFGDTPYPKTWEDLRKISGEVSKKNGDIVEMKGFEMMDTDSLICNYLAMLLQQGGQYLKDDGSIDFATPEGVKAMEEILDMYNNGECDLENLTAGEYCYNDVYQDKGYMASVGSWAIGEGSGSYDLTYGEDYEYVPVPQYGEQMAFASETGWGIIIPENGANKEAAWEFVKFFSEPENLVQHNIACNQLPPRKSLLDSEEYKEAMPNVAFLLDILPSGQWMGPYNTSDMREIFNQMFIDLCQSDSPDVEGALKDASAQITEGCQISYSMK